VLCHTTSLDIDPKDLITLLITLTVGNAPSAFPNGQGYPLNFLDAYHRFIDQGYFCALFPNCAIPRVRAFPTVRAMTPRL
jgi:hypothetical protein